MRAERTVGFAEPHGSGAIIVVDVTPGAPRTEIAGVNKWRGSLKIKIASVPRKGEANEELLGLLAEKLGVKRESIRIMSGEKSSRKKLFVPLSPVRVASILGEI